MITSGYMGKVLRIDLDTRKATVEDIGPNEYLQFLGGRGLGQAENGKQ